MRWLKDHLWLIAIAIIAILTFVTAVLLRRKDAGTLKGLVNELKLEKQVIDEKAVAATLTATMDHATAATVIQERHKERVAKLDDAAKKKVEELSNDPEALVEHLLRSTL